MVIGSSNEGAKKSHEQTEAFTVPDGRISDGRRFDTTNQFLYVANDGSADVSGFRFDASTGGLTLITGSPFPAGNLPDFLATL